MFKLLRFFSITSFISILIAAILLGFFYRHYALVSLAEQGNRENVTIGQVLSNTLWYQLVNLLDEDVEADRAEGMRNKLALEVRQQIIEKARGLDIAKVKLYNASTMTVFSTDLAQIGELQLKNKGVLDALNGITVSDFVHKNSFNALDRVLEDRDLLQTYMPFYDRDKKTILGVVEVYSDHTRMLERVSRSQWTMMLGTGLVLLLLYSVLFLIVRHANRILLRQDGDLLASLEELNRVKQGLEFNVAERTRTLTISNQLLEQEINERVRIEQALRERERRIRAIMDNIFNAIITIDEEGVIASFNQTAERLFGYTANEAIGQPVAILTTPGHLISADHLRPDEPLDAQSYPAARITELTAKRKNGSSFPIELTVTRIDESDHPGYIGIIRDISERKRTETELEETRQKYFHQEKMAAIGTLAAGIVHEIGNPIAAISGLIHDMSDDPDNSTLDEENRSNLVMVLDQVERLINITRDVSEFANPHVGELELLDLNNLIGKTCRLLRHDKRLSGVDIVLDLDQQLLAILGIGDQLVQVIMNLIINSADAVSEIGDRKPLIQISTRMKDDTVVITVTDNGCGIKPEDIEHATEAFFTTKSMGKGTGLGLSLCHSIVTAHNGTMKISSTLGQGTEVEVIVPVD